MTVTAASPEHNRLIRATIAEMQRQGCTNIKAAHVGDSYTTPAQMGGLIPDVTGHFNSLPLVVECETHNRLSQQHTSDQWRTFFQYALQRGGYFVEVMANPDVDAAKLLLKRVCGSMTNCIDWSF